MSSSPTVDDLLSVHPIVRQIIDRDCHVAWSYRDVIRHVISRLRDGRATYRRMSRQERREFIRQCITCHKYNRRLYLDVMYPSYGATRKER
jgi:hypothetical protein